MSNRGACFVLVDFLESLLMYLYLSCGAGLDFVSGLTGLIHNLEWSITPLENPGVATKSLSAFLRPRMLSFVERLGLISV